MKDDPNRDPSDEGTPPPKMLMVSSTKYRMVFRAWRRAQDGRNRLAEAFEKQSAENYELKQELAQLRSQPGTETEGHPH
ncbi:hypothetical protein OG413_44680 [Streptomyces sp. NBC_01433]|uniref:hypothetical protein n=1 Tax=Streptomyces sp. NBC_01433 TaxID=2903864 RepID=UPI00225AD43E|nr:hypothetical protein [Streptomyces sp. NBC_01433]MCX4682281.1 hypothetical protein [Streptomyces sp. NBC_01433]